MPLLVNLRHLEAHSVHLQGQISIAELDIETKDELIRLEGPLEHDLEIEKFEGGILVKGTLGLDLQCQCARCLKDFPLRLNLGDWTRHLPLEGEEKVPVANDCVDLTPYVREDMLLEFPQHPLCDPECVGLQKAFIGKPQNTSSPGRSEKGSPAWDELNKLKF